MKKDSRSPAGSEPVDVPAGHTRKIRKQLLTWYRKNRRDLPWRRTDNPYFIWVSEVMLQQTRVDTVIPYYERFIRRFPDIRSLAKADLEAAIKMWEGLGYYARVRNLHRAAKVATGKWGGRVPGSREAFAALPGVGDYIASAVLSIAFGQPCPVVDGNVKRVLSRLYCIDSPVNDASSLENFKRPAAELLDRKAPADFNQAIMELGALICRPKNPGCPSCPLKDGCLSYREGTTADYPKRTARRRIPEHRMASAVIWKNECVLIVRRPEEGLLGGLWEFPGTPIEEGETTACACERMTSEILGIKAKIVSRPAAVRHAYTHFKIVSYIFICHYVSGRVKRNGWIRHQWTKRQSLNRHPFSKASLNVMPYL